MNISTTKSSLFITEVQGAQESLEIQFVPQELNWTRVGNWVNVPIVGRNNSKKHLTGGEDNLSLSLDFNSRFEDEKNLCIRKLSWLQSLTMTDGFSGPPRNVILNWGTSELFRYKLWIVKSVKGRMSDFHSDFNLDPTQIYIDLELELDPQENQRVNEVRIQNNDFLLPGRTLSRG